MLNPRLLNLVAIGGALLLLTVLVMDRNHQRSLARERGEKLEMICASVRDAAGNPKLACKDVVKQIGEMSDSIGQLKRGIAEQNAAVNELARKSANQQKEAAKASQKAKERADKALATSVRLKASSRAGGPPCEPSEELKEAWR